MRISKKSAFYYVLNGIVALVGILGTFQTAEAISCTCAAGSMKFVTLSNDNISDCKQLNGTTVSIGSESVTVKNCKKS
jgi:hypothetical protein